MLRIRLNSKDFIRDEEEKKSKSNAVEQDQRADWTRNKITDHCQQHYNVIERRTTAEN